MKIFNPIKPTLVTLLAVAYPGTQGGSNPSVAVNTTGATLLVAMLCGYNTATTISADTGSNTWHYILPEGSGSQGNIQIGYVYGPTTSASHTFTVAGGSSYPGAVIFAFSGTLTTSAVLGATSGNQTSSNPAAIQPGSISPNVGDIVVTGWIQLTGSPTPCAIAAPFPGFYSVVASDAGFAAFLLSDGSPINPSWSTTGSAQGYTPIPSVVAAFHTATGNPNALVFGSS